MTQLAPLVNKDLTKQVLIIQDPWQIGPTELIAFALEMMHKGSDFDRRLAYLILDVGMETLIKTFLTLPVSITDTKTSYSKRKAAAEGSFHDLVSGLREAAPKRAMKFDLDHIHYYHNIRNTLYHQGSTVPTVRLEHLSGYASLACSMLAELLDVDLTEQLTAPKIADQKRDKSALASSDDDDPVVDSVEVQISSGRYRLMRLKSQSIRILHLESGKNVKPVKPMLRKIIQEKSLPVDLEYAPGKAKITRRLGKEVIGQLK